MEVKKMWEIPAPPKSENVDKRIDETAVPYTYREDLQREDPEKEDEEQNEGGFGEES